MCRGLRWDSQRERGAMLRKHRIDHSGSAGTENVTLTDSWQANYSNFPERERESEWETNAGHFVWENYTWKEKIRTRNRNDVIKNNVIVLPNWRNRKKLSDYGEWKRLNKNFFAYNRLTSLKSPFLTNGWTSTRVYLCPTVPPPRSITAHSTIVSDWLPVTFYQSSAVFPSKINIRCTAILLKPFTNVTTAIRVSTCFRGWYFIIIRGEETHVSYTEV